MNNWIEFNQISPILDVPYDLVKISNIFQMFNVIVCLSDGILRRSEVSSSFLLLVNAG